MKILSNVGDSKIEFLIDKIKEYFFFTEYRTANLQSLDIKHLSQADVIFRNNKLNIKNIGIISLKIDIRLNDVDELDCI